MIKCRNCDRETLVMDKDLIFCTECGEGFKLLIEDKIERSDRINSGRRCKNCDQEIYPFWEEDGVLGGWAHRANTKNCKELSI